MNIRELGNHDFKALVSLLEQLGYPGNSEDELSRRHAFFIKHHGIVWVAEDTNQEVMGFVAIAFMPMIHYDGLLARIAGICVDQGARGKGIGAALIRHIEKYCKEQGAIILEVTTKLERWRAHQFYLGNGFSETHKRYNKYL